MDLPDKSIFGSDPLIGCPFDDLEMRMVANWKGFSVGDVVEFQGLNEVGTNRRPWIRGLIVAIGENAKYLDGNPFVAFMVRGTTKTLHLLTQREIQQVIG